MCERILAYPVKNPANRIDVFINRDSSPYPTLVCTWNGPRDKPCPWAERSKGANLCVVELITTNDQPPFFCGNPFAV